MLNVPSKCTQKSNHRLTPTIVDHLVGEFFSLEVSTDFSVIICEGNNGRWPLFGSNRNGILQPFVLLQTEKV